MKVGAYSLVALIAILGTVEATTNKVVELSIGQPLPPLPSQPLPPQQPQAIENGPHQKYALVGIIPQQPQPQQAYSQSYSQSEQEQRQEPLPGTKGGELRKPLYKQPAQPGALAFVLFRPLQSSPALETYQEKPLRQAEGVKGAARAPSKPFRQAEPAPVKGAAPVQEQRKTRLSLRPLRDQPTKGRNPQLIRPLYQERQPTKGIRANEPFEQQRQTGEEDWARQQQEPEIEQQPEGLPQQPPAGPAQHGAYAEAGYGGKFLKLKSTFEKLKSKLTLGSSYVVSGEEIVTPGPAPIEQQQQEHIPDEEVEQQREELPEQQKEEEQRYEQAHEQRYEQAHEQKYEQAHEQRFEQPREQRFEQPREQRYEQPREQRYEQPREQRYEQPQEQRYEQAREQQQSQELPAAPQEEERQELKRPEAEPKEQDDGFSRRQEQPRLTSSKLAAPKQEARESSKKIH